MQSQRLAAKSTNLLFLIFDLSQELLLGSLDIGLPLLQGQPLGGPPLGLSSLVGLLGVGRVLADGGMGLLVGLLDLKLTLNVLVGGCIAQK